MGVVVVAGARGDRVFVAGLGGTAAAAASSSSGGGGLGDYFGFLLLLLLLLLRLLLSWSLWYCPGGGIACSFCIQRPRGWPAL